MSSKVLGSYLKTYGLEANQDEIQAIIEPELAGMSKTLAPLLAKLIWQRISMVSLFPWETGRTITEDLLIDALKQVRGMVDNQLILKVK